MSYFFDESTIEINCSEKLAEILKVVRFGIVSDGSHVIFEESSTVCVYPRKFIYSTQKMHLE